MFNYPRTVRGAVWSAVFTGLVFFAIFVIMGLPGDREIEWGLAALVGVLGAALNAIASAVNMRALARKERKASQAGETD